MRGVNLRRPATVAGLIGLVVVALTGIAGGPGGVLTVAAAYLFLTALWALFRGSSWLGRSSRAGAAGLLAGSLVLVGIGGATAGPTPGPSVESPAEASPSPLASGSTPAPSPLPTPAATTAGTAPPPPTAPAAPLAPVGAGATTVPPGPALAAARELPVKGRAPRTGYDRDLFGSGWVDVDRNGCDTRNDILARDLASETYRPGTRDCVVLTGTLADPFSGRPIDFVRGNTTSNAVQIDHVVALSDAWQKGAQSWDEARRVAFANDPLNLLAVDGPLNGQKGDGDTATWLPPNRGFRCAYVARQVAVKRAYGLWATQAEQDAMVRVLSACPAEPLLTAADEPAAAAGPAPATAGPAPAATRPPAPSPTAGPPAPAPAPVPAPAGVPFENCTAARAAGAAPVRLGDPGYGRHLDRDGDGVGCE